MAVPCRERCSWRDWLVYSIFGKGDLMSIHRVNSAQRRIARQQLVHVLRSQLIRVQATVARQQLVIEAQERDLIDMEVAQQTRGMALPQRTEWR
jgi:hypothetical protein